MKQLRLPLALVVELGVLLVGILPVYSYTVYCRSGNFHIKIICVKNFRVVRFSWFRTIREFFLTVDDYNMDDCLERS